MKRFCLTLDLRPDPEAIERYETLHKAVWPEVEASLRAAGIACMEIYRLGTRLCMLIEAEDGFSFERKAAMDRSNPKVLEWEALMGQFQDVSEGSDPVARWQRMEQVYRLGPHRS